MKKGTILVAINTNDDQEHVWGHIEIEAVLGERFAYHPVVGKDYKQWKYAVTHIGTGLTLNGQYRYSKEEAIKLVKAFDVAGVDYSWQDIHVDYDGYGRAYTMLYDANLRHDARDIFNSVITPV